MEIVQDHAGQFAEVVSMIQQSKATTMISMANTALSELYREVGNRILDKKCGSNKPATGCRLR